MKKKLNIFISYRRVDSMDFAGRLYDNLVSEYEMVFFDTEGGIGAGENFLNVIVKNIDEADVFLMVIGKDSAKEFKERESKDDYVLKEVIQAQKSFCMVIPILVNGVNSIEYLPEEIDFIRELSFYQFSHVKFSLNVEGLKQEIDKCRPKLKEQIEHSFVSHIMEELSYKRAILLFSQRFNNIEIYYQSIKNSLQEKFGQNFYRVSMPPTKIEKKYFASVAKSCGIDEPIEEFQDWKDAIQKKLDDGEDMMLFIPDIEDGNDKYNRKFATTIRNLHNEYTNLSVLFIGRKKLASLVFREKHLSPLRSLGVQAFFPDDEVTLKEGDIQMVLEKILSQKENLCTLLKKEKLEKYHSPWSEDKVINHLFWENLLIRDVDKYFVWRNQEIRKIGQEVLECSK